MESPWLGHQVYKQCKTHHPSGFLTYYMTSGTLVVGHHYGWQCQDSILPHAPCSLVLELTQGLLTIKGFPWRTLQGNLTSKTLLPWRWHTMLKLLFTVWRSLHEILQCIDWYLASQDALEVMSVTDWVTDWVSDRSYWLDWCDPCEQGYLQKT